MHVPAIAAIGDLPYELAGLLPNREHSRDLMALIEGLPENRSGRRCIVGVFAADPFLNCRRVAGRLLAKGYDQVTNIPPVAAYGAAFLGTLDKVGSGRVQEHRNLSQLAEHGLSVSPAMAAIDGLPAALAWSPQRLWIAPSFDMLGGGASCADLLLKLCRAVARRTNVPAVLIAGRTGISANDAFRSGAGGILFDDD